jgi:hypothetical protein
MTIWLPIPKKRDVVIATILFLVGFGTVLYWAYKLGCFLYNHIHWT